MTVTLKKPQLSRRFLNEKGEIFSSATELADAAFKDAVKQLGPQTSALAGINAFLVDFVYANRDALKSILDFDFTPALTAADEGSEQPAPATQKPAFTKPNATITEKDLGEATEAALADLKAV